MRSLEQPIDLHRQYSQLFYLVAGFGFGFAAEYFDELNEQVYRDSYGNPHHKEAL